MTIEEEIKEIEEKLSTTKYNKSAETYFAKLKTKLAQLKEKLSKSASVGKAQSLGYGLKKHGDATVILAGFPSVGKSTLLNQLTNAESEVAAYDFTTLTVVPGMMKYRQANIQIFDVPGLISGAAGGKGRGKEVIAVLRNADLIILLVDAAKPDQLEKMEKELYEANFRLDKAPPAVTLKKTTYGGVVLDKSNTVKLSDEVIKEVLHESGYLNVQVLVRGNPTVDDFVDAIISNRKYVPALRVLNKIDTVKELPKARHDLAICAEKGQNMDKLRDLIYKKLRFISLFLKKQGKKADYEEPLIMREGATVRDVCEHLHNDFVRRFRYAELWGPSAKFDAQKVHLDHALKDGDVLELILEK